MMGRGGKTGSGRQASESQDNQMRRERLRAGAAAGEEAERYYADHVAVSIQQAFSQISR